MASETLPPATVPLSRQVRRSGRAAIGAGKVATGAADGFPAVATAGAAASRGQPMKAKTQSATSGTIAPMPVRVSNTAISPSQPGRPALATMRQAIHAAKTSATAAKALLKPNSANREEMVNISAPGLALGRRRFAGRPVAEGQDRHDHQQAHDRHEMQQRQRAGETCANEDAPGRNHQQQRQHDMADGQDEQYPSAH